MYGPMDSSTAAGFTFFHYDMSICDELKSQFAKILKNLFCFILTKDAHKTATQHLGPKSLNTMKLRNQQHCKCFLGGMFHL